MSMPDHNDDIATLRRLIAEPKWGLDEENRMPTAAETALLVVELREIFLLAEAIAETYPAISRALLNEGWSLLSGFEPYRILAEHFYHPEVMYHRWSRSEAVVLTEIECVRSRAAEIQSSVREYLLRIDAAFASLH